MATSIWFLTAEGGDVRVSRARALAASSPLAESSRALSRGASLLPLSSLCPNLLRRRRRPRAGHHRKALHGHDRAVGGGDFLGGGEQARQARCAGRRAPPGCASGSAPGARNCARVASALSGTPLLTLHHCRRYCAAAASAAATASAAAATPCATPPPPLFSAPSFFFFLLAPPLRPPLQDVPPILVTPKYYLVSILRGGVYVLATVATEVRARARALRVANARPARAPRRAADFARLSLSLSCARPRHRPLPLLRALGCRRRRCR